MELTPIENIKIIAIDDSGIHLCQEGEHHVAAIEAKAGLDRIKEGLGKDNKCSAYSSVMLPINTVA